MKLTPKQAKRIADDYEQTAKVAELVYTTEEELTIVRKRHGRGFMYFENEQKITDKTSLNYFKSLVIPPAWSNVRISSNPESHLQALGRDSKGRKQYRYHPRWNQIRNSTKFFRMNSFGRLLPKIRTQVEKDLNRKKLDQKKVLALIIRLMEETHIRIGSGEYARKNKTYGLSTMRNRYLKERNGELFFEFVGKKGKQHQISIDDRELKKLIIQCEEIPGWELFQYLDDENNHNSIDSGMVNEYIQKITKGSFTAKDFRTWAASKIFLETIMDFEKAETKNDRQKNVIKACDITASELGNTRTVCKNYYIHPAIVQAYENDEIGRYTASGKNNSLKLESSEKILLNIIENYCFEIDDIS